MSMPRRLGLIEFKLGRSRFSPSCTSNKSPRVHLESKKNVGRGETLPRVARWGDEQQVSNSTTAWPENDQLWLGSGNQDMIYRRTTYTAITFICELNVWEILTSGH